MRNEQGERKTGSIQTDREWDAARGLSIDMRMAGKTYANVLLKAPPDIALTATRFIAGEMPGECPNIVVFDCDWIDEGRAQRLLDWYLERGSRGRLTARVLLLREVHALTPACQAHLSALLDQQSSNAARVVASTSTDLYGRVIDERFDPALYYQLNIITLGPQEIGMISMPLRPMPVISAGDSRPF